MPGPVATEAKIIALIIALIIAFLAGFQVESWRAGKRIADIEVAAQKRYSKATTENLTKLVAAQKTGETLTARVSGLETTLYAFAEEKNREIKNLSTGRPCLGGAVVRLLNATSGGGWRPGSVPQATGLALPAAAAPASDPDADGYATDTDVGLWIGQCQRGYETCRGRIQAISDFYEGMK